MDIATASSQSLYSYQSALAGGSQAGAVLQALTQAYSNANNLASSDTSVDPLSNLAGEASLSPLVSAIYTQSRAASSGTGTAPSLGISASQLFGGLDSSSASALLSGLSSDAAAGLQGFDTATTGASALASAQYAAQQAYGGGTLSADAQAQANAETQAANGTNSADATAATTPAASYVDQALQTAQLAAMNNTFTLLA